MKHASLVFSHHCERYCVNPTIKSSAKLLPARALAGGSFPRPFTFPQKSFFPSAGETIQWKNSKLQLYPHPVGFEVSVQQNRFLNKTSCYLTHLNPRTYERTLKSCLMDHP
jgi:hypothetical protein